MVATQAGTGLDTTDMVEVTIRLDRSQSGRMGEIVHALEALGLCQTVRHDRFAIVNGSVGADRLDALRGVAGVASVREDQTYRTQAS